MEPQGAGDADEPNGEPPSVIRTYTLKHDKGDEVLPLLMAYRKVLNSMLGDIWKTVTWKKVRIRGKKQFRLFPRYRDDSYSRPAGSGGGSPRACPRSCAGRPGRATCWPGTSAGQRRRGDGPYYVARPPAVNRAGPGGPAAHV